MFRVITPSNRVTDSRPFEETFRPYVQGLRSPFIYFDTPEINNPLNQSYKPKDLNPHLCFSRRS